LEKWPNFFIVGAPRAGTTSLYDYLNRTEGIYMSPRKEPHYFTTFGESFLYPPPIRDKKKYLELFSNVKDEKVIGEGSTSYLRDPNVPKLIQKVSPNAKIIIILRDPVERAYSNYLLRVSSGKTYSFSEAVKKAIDVDYSQYDGTIVHAGWYYKQVKGYQDVFGVDSVKILIFEEFIKDPKKTIKEVLDFLRVDADPPESMELVHNILTKPRGKLSTSILTNRTIRKSGRALLPESVAEFMVRKVLGKKITKQKMPKEDRVFLENLYSDDVLKLQKIVDKKLLWDWFNVS